MPETFDAKKIRADFPVLDQMVNDEPLIYLDNAATTQKPQAVLDVLNHYYLHDNANVHRGVHTLAERSTAEFEAARKKSNNLSMPIAIKKLFLPKAQPIV